MTSGAAPVVLYGALRSGTTLLRLILDAHPDIRCPGERDFMLDSLRPEGAGFVLDTDALRADRIFLSSGLSVPKQTEGSAAFDSFLAEERARHDKSHHCLVMHRKLDVLLEIRPDIRIIHLLRDPRDVARSSIGMGWAGNTWFGIDHWIETERAWETQMARLAESQVFTLQYETLLRAPEQVLGDLCEFIGTAYDPQMLSYSAGTTYEPLDPVLAEQWRTKQTEQEVADVEFKIGRLLTDRGYQPSGFLPKPPGALRKLQLIVQNKQYKWKTRFDRFGYLDPILDLVSRRIGWAGLGRNAQGRIREKQKQYLK